MGFLTYLIPYKRSYYHLNLKGDLFLNKLENIRVQLEEEYEPGKHYLIHYPDSSYFVFKNKKINPGNNSGGYYRYVYTMTNDFVIIERIMKYNVMVYILISILCVAPALGIITGAIYSGESGILGVLALPLLFYLLFLLVFQFETWIIHDIFKENFKDNIVEVIVVPKAA